MGSPDPNGCAHCGRADCAVGKLRAEYKAASNPIDSVDYVRAVGLRAALSDAENDCDRRPAVDWQAVAREERARADKVERERDEAAACAWKSVVHLLADGELRGAEAEGARAHAAGCAACGRDLEDALQLGALVRSSSNGGTDGGDHA